jgi:hypothetical protein
MYFKFNPKEFGTGTDNNPSSSTEPIVIKQFHPKEDGLRRG